MVSVVQSFEFLREFCRPSISPQSLAGSSGYKDTARMCVEAALALVDLPKSQRAGGVYSPAAACTLSVHLSQNQGVERENVQVISGWVNK